MSLQQTKAQLVRLLEDADSKVVALSGKWGTGKSHLLDEVRKSAKDDKVRDALYVSLFGLADMAEVKLKLLQCALPKAESNETAWKWASGTWKAAKTALVGFNKAFGALEELQLLAVPVMLKDKVVVLDDIERKHDRLSIDEILGFIDEFTRQQGCRFILVLNSDQLRGRDIWETLREKVVDQELRLDTSAQEAFTIAADLTKPDYPDAVRKAVEACGLTNIRIIRKVIKATNSIIGHRQGLAPAVLARFIPSTVLLAAIHYRGIKDGPNFKFVLSRSHHGEMFEAFLEKPAGEEPPNEEKQRESRWKLLMAELGIVGCDDFEVMVVEYLESGLFDVGGVSAIMDRYLEEAGTLEARHAANAFMATAAWDYRPSEAQLLDRAKAMVDAAARLDPYHVSALARCVAGLGSEGAAVADAMVDAWIAAFRQHGRGLPEEDVSPRVFHPRIKIEFEHAERAQQASMTVYDAAMHISEHSAWGTRQEVALNRASPEDYETTILGQDADGFRRFMAHMLRMCGPGPYHEHFGPGILAFRSACAGIVERGDPPRLAVLLKRLFRDSGLGELPPPALGGEMVETAAALERAV